MLIVCILLLLSLCVNIVLGGLLARSAQQHMHMQQRHHALALEHERVLALVGEHMDITTHNPYAQE